jgi:hypothetical protein
MKKLSALLRFTLLFISCGPAINITKYNANLYRGQVSKPDSIFIPKPIRIKTYSKKSSYPYIHKNGYKSYKITVSKTVKDKNSFFANELIFYSTYSSFYTRKLMYEKFGNWNNNLFIRGIRTPFLIWNKVKLFANKDAYYYVVAGGFECTTCDEYDSIYASIMILDENKNDCLSNKNLELKKEIIGFFSKGITNLTNSTEFYDKFWNVVNTKK